MKKLVIFPIFFALLALISWNTNGNINIPDANFKAYFVKNFDANKDGEISYEEALKVTEIDCSKSEIQSLKGIEHFVNLITLICSENKLTSLDMSKNSALTYLQCGHNQITILDVSNNFALNNLKCAPMETLKAIILGDGQVINESEWPSNTNISGVGIKINFPDANFKAYLVKNFDANKDGEISYEEALKVTEINCSKSEIQSLKGIEYFVNLIDLDCSDNQLSTLDVSKHSVLTYLTCYNNQLTALDVSKNIELEMLACLSNELTSLDLSNNILLCDLLCSSNALTSLDLSKNSDLEVLYCGKNQLVTLNLPKNNALESVDCSNNQLTTLDVSNSRELELLSCGFNQLTSLDVSNNIMLADLICCVNKITTLDVSKNSELSSIDCSLMETLKTLTLKKRQTIEGIAPSRNTDYIPEHTNILYVK